MGVEHLLGARKREVIRDPNQPPLPGFEVTVITKEPKPIKEDEDPPTFVPILDEDLFLKQLHEDTLERAHA